MFRNFSILIVDDEPLICETIKDYLLEMNISKIEIAHSKIEAEKILELIQYDLVLLDIRMKGRLDGLDLGLFLDKQNIPFIYITAHSDIEIATKMVETNARGYISKPIRKNELFVNLSLVLKSISLEKQSQIKVPFGNQIKSIPIDEIIFIKSNGNYIELYLENESKILVRNTIDKIKTEINDTRFKQCHRSYIVNVNYIEKITFSEIITKSKHQISLSRSFVQDFKSIKNKSVS